MSSGAKSFHPNWQKSHPITRHCTIQPNPEHDQTNPTNFTEVNYANETQNGYSC